MEREEPDEREIAIKEYIKNGREINAILRGIIPLKGISTFTFFNTVKILDDIIKNSKLKRPFRLFRGISGDYCQQLLSQIKEGNNTIKDFGYVSFTYDFNVAKQYALECKGFGIILIYESDPGEHALFIDESDREILFPRKSTFNIIRLREEIIDSCKVIFIYLGRDKSETK